MSFKGKTRTLLLNGTLLASCWYTAQNSMAMETQFLAQGGMRYTLSTFDLTYLSYKDETGHEYVNAQTGEIDATLAVYSNSYLLSSTFRRSYTDAEKFQTETGSAPFIDNIRYWLKNPGGSRVALSPHLYVNTKGHITIRAQYYANGLYAGNDGESFREYMKTSPFQIEAAIYAKDANNNTIGSSSAVLPNASKISDLNAQCINQPKPGQTFFPLMKIDSQILHTLESSFDLPEGGFTLSLQVANKAPGVGFTIAKLIVEIRPD